MVDVEQRALRALEQDALARAALAVEQIPGHVHVGQDFGRDLGELGHQLGLGELRLAETAAQRVVVHEDAVDLGTQRVEVLQILHADGAPAHLVLVGRADAAPGRADLARARRSFAHDVELAVQRQDQGGVLGNAQVVRADRHALALQPLDLAAQRPRIDDDAVADDGELARADHAGGQQRQLVGLAADHQGVAGVVAALEAHHDVGALARASRRSCPCPRRPTGRRSRRRLPLSYSIHVTAGPTRCVNSCRATAPAAGRYRCRRAPLSCHFPKSSAGREGIVRKAMRGTIA